MKFNETDFLENLRTLNYKNINEVPEIRDSFFDSLMVCADNVPDYLEGLSDSYASEIGKPYEGSPVKNFILSNIFGNEIRNQLTDGIIEDKKSNLYINGREAKLVVTYVGAIKGEKKLIAEDATHFDFFKQRLLLGLITRYSRDFATGLNKDLTRLNQLITIYIEHTKNIDLRAQTDFIVDEEYLSELISHRNHGTLSQRQCIDTLNSLINRKFPIEKPKYYEKIAYGYREYRK